MKKERSMSELIADTLRETENGLTKHGIYMGQVLSKNAYSSKDGGILVCLEIEASKFYPRYTFTKEGEKCGDNL